MRSWDPNDESLLKQVILSSLCQSQPTFHALPTLPPLVRDPSLYCSESQTNSHRYRSPVWADSALHAAVTATMRLIHSPLETIKKKTESLHCVHFN